MKKFIFSLIILIGASSAYADANLAMRKYLYEKYADESKSHYQTLGDLFKSGSAPDVKKLVGVHWAGRCFPKRTPNIPINAGYIVRVAKKPDIGPIERDEEIYEAASYFAPGRLPDYLDKMTIDKINKRIDFDLSKVKFYDDSISIEVGNGIISKLKISGEYLINEISFRIGEDVGPIKKSTYETGTRCYYFISKYKKYRANGKKHRANGKK